MTYGVIVVFAQRLKELRIKRRMSQAGLAKVLGVVQGTVGNWESGTREPNFIILSRVADFFEVSIGYMVGTESDTRPRFGYRCSKLK
jgi:transcriptional regulator with XRE-family HTH domain